MNTLETKRSRRARKPFAPTTALAQSLEFTDDAMQVFLTDGRILTVPLIWLPVLRHATPEQRANYQIGAGGSGLHWPDLDEDLSVTGLMGGGK